MQFTRWGRQRLPFFCSLCLWSDHKEQDEERLRAPDTGERCYLPTEDAAPRRVRRGRRVRGVRRSLLGGISREALRKRVVSGSVVALRDDAGLVRYPRWQFDVASGAPFGVIKKLDEVFGDAGLDSWALAAFVTAPQPELGNRAPVGLFADADIEPLLLAAHPTVADLKR